MEVNRAQLSDIFGVALTTVDEWRRKGMPHEKRGKYVIFDSAKAFNWLVNDSEVLDLNKERAKLAQKQREKTALQVEEMKGELVSAEEVRQAWCNLVANCRSKLISLPVKAATELVGIDTMAKVQAILKEYIHEALGELEQNSRA